MKEAGRWGGGGGGTGPRAYVHISSLPYCMKECNGLQPTRMTRGLAPTRHGCEAQFLTSCQSLPTRAPQALTGPQTTHIEYQCISNTNTINLHMHRRIISHSWKSVLFHNEKPFIFSVCTSKDLWLRWRRLTPNHFKSVTLCSCHILFVRVM